MSTAQFMAILEQTVMGVIIKHAFFGKLLMDQELVIDNNVQTACTDGKQIRVNQAWFLSIREHLRMFVFAHEVMHSAFCHHLRRGSRLPRLWNIACDYVINLLLVESGLISYAECNKSYLCDTKYAGLSEEQVYTMLKQDGDDKQEPPADCPVNPAPQDDADQDQGEDGDEQGEDGQDGDQQGDDGDGDQDGASEGAGSSQDGDEQGEDGQGAGKGQDDAQGDIADPPCDPKTSAGEVKDGKNASDKKAAENEQTEWIVRMEQAARAAEKRGQSAGWIKEMIEAAKQAQLDWREVLWDFMLQYGQGSDDVTYARINNRTRHLEGKLGGRLPRTVGIDAEELVIGIDTSASVPSWALSEFAAEIADIRETLGCRIHLVQCDTRIVDTQVSESSEEPFIIEYKGRGGTEFEPVFKYCEESAPATQALVYLTDLECTLPAEPSYPVLWITPWKVAKAGYGTVVTMGGRESRR